MVTPTFDVFISYAREDRDGLVELLAEKLRARGLELWYDQSTPRPGASIGDAIHEAVTRSRMSVIVLSQFYFAKAWTRYELRALRQRELFAGHPIVPILHNITVDEVRNADAALADKLALDTSAHDLEQIVGEIVRQLRAGERPRDDAPPSLLDIRCLGDCRRLGAQEAVVRLARYAQAAQLSPRSGEVACGYGLVLLHLKRFPEAIQQLERATQLSPEAAAPHYYHALALLRGRRPKTLTLPEARKILASLEMAILLDPSQAIFHAYALIIKRDYFQMNGLRVPGPGLDFHCEAMSDLRLSRAELGALLDLVVIRDDPLLNALRG